MILLILLGLGMILFGFFYLDDSGILKRSRMTWYDAVLIDEVEDELYDNIGGTKTRFFKAYEFEDEGELKIVRSQRPLKRITGKTGIKTRIFVDVKSRKAVDKRDFVLYCTIAGVLILLGIMLIGAVIYIRLTVKGAVL